MERISVLVQRKCLLLLSFLKGTQLSDFTETIAGYPILLAIGKMDL